MSTQTKENIKHYTGMTTGVIAIFLIYFSTFYTTFSLTDRIINGKESNSVVQVSKD